MARGERQKAHVRSRNRKDAILNEATRLFAERGYEGTSMSDLAQEVGLRKASLFHHFASKEDLRRAVLERVAPRASSALESTIQSSNNGDGEAFGKRLDAFSDALIGMLAEQPYAARLLIREAMEWDPHLHDKGKGNLGEALADSLDVGQRVLTEAQHAGYCRGEDPKQLLPTLLAIHVLPFALGAVMERFTGCSPWREPFISERRQAVRDQVRALVLSQAPPR